MEAFLVFIFWLLLACIVGGYASNRGRSGVFWIIFSLILSPLLGFLFVAASPNIAEEQRREAEKRSQEKRKRDENREQERQEQVELENSKTCPKCAESIKKAAKVCRYCGHEFEEGTAVQSGNQ